MKWLSYMVITYMLMALVWWTILLHGKNKEIYMAKVETLRLQGDLQNETLTQLTSNYRRQANMILGEGVVFGVSLLIGIWFIQRSFTRELEAREKQNNFLLSVTHELKSPLTSINLSLETLRRRNLNPEMVNELVGTALGESQRLENLINDLLLASRLDHSFQFVKQKIDLALLVTEVVGRYKNRNHPELKADVTDGQVPIWGDNKALEKIVTNLIENAIKYGAQSPVEISVKVDQEKKAVLTVKDQGPGIVHKERQRIFEKFYRIGSEQTRKTKGTGLGLFIVSKIVEGHYGTVAYHENKPKGSIFEVKLPLEDI